MITRIWIRGVVAVATIAICVCAVAAQDKSTVSGTPVLWERVTIPQRDLYWGPGGQAMFPVMKGIRYVDRQTGGNNLKFRLREKEGREWIVKAADESQPEVAANRLLWAIGYTTEIDYIVPKVSVPNWGKFSNVRFEARPDAIKRGGRWSWDDNPFKDTPEFAGLRIMMAMFNNWDLKDDNTVIFERDGKAFYVVSDIGSSFGKLAVHPQTRSGRSVNKPEDYASSKFIQAVDGGTIRFAYTGARSDLLNGLSVGHGRWLADLLNQLTDKQIQDAFRAANYEPEDVMTLAASFKARIAELDKVTQSVIARR